MRLAALVGLVMLGACSIGEPRQPQWTVVYRNGVDGEPLSGSKAALIDAVRAGLPIRVAWGGSFGEGDTQRSVEHVIDPVFITVMNGAEVAAQMPEHIAQRSYANAGDALFEEGGVMWRGLVSTTGAFDAVWVDRGSGKTIRRWPQRAALTWYAYGTPPADVTSLAAPGGVIRDAGRAGEIVGQ